MPGIEARAPERTDTSSGLSGSPNFLTTTRSIFSSAASVSRFTASGNFPPAALNCAQTPVEIVKPGGTGTPSRVISARFAPFPPSTSFMSPRPCACPSPKEKTLRAPLRVGFARGFFAPAGFARTLTASPRAAHRGNRAAHPARRAAASSCRARARSPSRPSPTRSRR